MHHSGRSLRRFAVTITAVLALFFAAGTAVWAAPGWLPLPFDDKAAPEEAPEPWYELSSDGTQLTVSLTDKQSSCSWKYGVSEPDVLALASREDEYQRWTVTFAPTGLAAGDVRLTFHYLAGQGEKPLSVRTLDLSVGEDRRISLAE